MAKRFRRILELGGLTSRLAQSEITHRVKRAFSNKDEHHAQEQEHHRNNAQLLTKRLSKMKGAAMKMGQQIAQAASAMDLPADVVATLNTLNHSAEPVPFAIIKREIERSLEMDLHQAFSEIDETPLGTASLAQAHAATTVDGAKVVIKVLHCGVDDAVEADLMALKAIVMSGRFLKRSKAELSSTFDEIAHHLRMELDYLGEAANIVAFRRAFKDDPDFRIPDVHPALCTERVLTMDRIEGVDVYAFRDTASEKAKARAGKLLPELYYRQLFTLKLLHADPHPGNYLFGEDGSIGLVDFGCVKRLNEYWLADFARAAIGTLNSDREAILKATEALGVWDGQCEIDAQLVWEFCDALGKPYRDGPTQLGADREQAYRDVTQASINFLKRPSVTVPKDVILVQRALGGMYQMARTLEATADFGEICHRHASHAIARSQGVLG